MSIVYQSGNDARIRSVSLADGSVHDVNTSPTAPLLETFGGGTRDASLWHEINDPGGTIGEQGGRLVASISGSAVLGDRGAEHLDASRFQRVEHVDRRNAVPNAVLSQ